MEHGLLGQFIDDVFELDSFINCSLEGIGYSTIAGEVTDTIRRLAKSGGEYHPLVNDDVYESRKKHYEKLEKFAEREIEKGHPYLFSLSCVKLWSILEAAVDFILIRLLQNSEQLKLSQRLLKIKGPLLPLLQASEDERVVFLREALLHDIGAELKIGIGRFEGPLDELGFGGAVASNVRRVLLELAEVRNVIVHKAGKIDSRLLERCPWLSFQIGESIRPVAADFKKYMGSAFWYLMELDQRWEERFGEKRQRNQKAAKLQKEINESLALEVVKSDGTAR